MSVMKMKMKMKMLCKLMRPRLMKVNRWTLQRLRSVFVLQVVEARELSGVFSSVYCLRYLFVVKLETYSVHWYSIPLQ